MRLEQFRKMAWDPLAGVRGDSSLDVTLASHKNTGCDSKQSQPCILNITPTVHNMCGGIISAGQPAPDSIPVLLVGVGRGRLAGEGKMVNSYTSKSRQIYPASTTEVCEAMEFEDISETKEFIEVKHLEVQKCYEFIEEEPEDNNFTVEVWYPELDEYRNINENNKYDDFKSVSGQAGMKKTDENESVDFESSGRPASMKKTDDIENVETANSEFNEMNSAMTKSEHSEHSERTEMIEDSVEYMNKSEVSCAMVKSNVEVMELEEMNNPEVSCAMIMSNEGIMEVEEMEVVKEASDTKDRHEKKTQKRIEDCWGITLRKPVTSSLSIKKKPSSIKKIKGIKTGKVTKPISKGKKSSCKHTAH